MSTSQTLVQTLLLSRRLIGMALASVCFCFVACGDVREVSGVYTESLGTVHQDERHYALRMTIFEYDGYVGGWVEYYGFGGVNRDDAPYIQPDDCAYFGPFRRAETLTVIRVKSPIDHRHILLRMAPDGRRLLHAEIENDGGVFREGKTPEALIFEKQRDAPAEGCPSQANLLTHQLFLGAPNRMHGIAHSAWEQK